MRSRLCTITDTIFSPHSRQCIDANTDTTNFAMTTIHHSSNTHATPHNRRQTHQQRRHTTTTPPPATYHVPHATTWQTVLQRHISTQVNTSLPRAKVHAHFCFKWYAFHAGIPGQLYRASFSLNNERAVSCTLALSAQRALTEPGITAIVIENRNRDEM